MHAGIEISLDGRRTRIDLAGLTGTAGVTVYGQTQVVRTLIAKRLAAGGGIVFEAGDVEPLDVGTGRPRLRYRSGGVEHELVCDFIAGCDGYHGVSRGHVPGARVRERVWPHAWLGILAEAPPPSTELIYARHPRGFALYSMRPPGRSRLYLQCDPGIDLAEWPDERIWEELRRRLGPEDAGMLRTARCSNGWWRRCAAS